MPSTGTLAALAFFLGAMTLSAFWLLAVDRRALRPVMTTTALVIALGGYAAAWIAASRP